jgi:hypothetical protein
MPVPLVGLRRSSTQARSARRAIKSRQRRRASAEPRSGTREP